MFVKINSEAELERFAANAAPGSVCEYYNGDLARDRAHVDDKGESHGSVKLNRLAHAALRYAKLGVLHLVQRREGEGSYAYLAVRSA